MSLYRDFDQGAPNRITKSRSPLNSAQPEPSNEPRLHDMRQDDIARKDKTERYPIGRGQRDETQKAREPGVREGYSDCSNDEGCRDKRCAGSALEKRNLRCSNNMDDQGLGKQGFDEPASLKQCWIVPRIEDVEHREISDIIEDRADRTDEQHEFRDVANVPLPRYRQILRIDVVGRNRGLREVVKQIIGEHLDRRHRQKRQEDTGPEYTEHVAKIGTRAHLDIFGDVAEYLSALD